MNQTTAPTARTLERRLERAYVASTGPSGWYADTRAQARALAQAHGTTLSVAAGVIAATSPRQQWRRNLYVSGELLAGREPSGVFGDAKRKARRIIAGERPLSVLSGPKVRAFYRAIIGDHHAVVIDTWVAKVFGIAAGDVTKRYPELERILRRVASRHDATPAAVQAAVWVLVRGRED